jgi:predicted nucleic acid-binding protein
MPSEVAGAIRWAEIRGVISQQTATAAYLDLLALPVELFEYRSFAARIWQLRANVTPTDAWYVALAEVLDAPLATLDRRLSRAPGPTCRFLTPETSP